MTLTFGGFTGPLYVWLDILSNGFIPAALDVTDALEPMHTHEIQRSAHRIRRRAATACSASLI